VRVATQCQSTTPTKAFLPHQRVTTEGKAMHKAYEEYFESLAEGDEALSFAEFAEALL
jgi:hypothetical protein